MEVDDPVARQNWKKVVVPQVAELAIELQRDLLRLEAPGDLDERVVQALRFGRSELRFDRFVVSIANPQVNRLSNVSDAMQAVYERLHDGSLGEDRIARIDHFPGACVKCHCCESICSVGALHVDDGVDIAAIVDGSRAAPCDGAARLHRRQHRRHPRTRSPLRCGATSTRNRYPF